MMALDEVRTQLARWLGKGDLTSTMAAIDLAAVLLSVSGSTAPDWLDAIMQPLDTCAQLGQSTQFTGTAAQYTLVMNERPARWPG